MTTTRYLTPDHLEDVLALQDAVMDSLLKVGAAHFVIPRSEDYFHAHLGGTPHAMIGLFEKNDLVAQAIFHTPEHSPVTYTGLPTLPGETGEHRITILQGALVHPDHRGQGHMKTLLTGWLNWANENGFDHAVSRIEVSHRASWGTFMKHGFRLINVLTDARDDAHVYVAHRAIQSDEKQGTDFESCAQDDLAAQQACFAQGYIITDFEKDTERFKLAR